MPEKSTEKQASAAGIDFWREISSIDAESENTGEWAAAFEPALKERLAAEAVQIFPLSAQEIPSGLAQPQDFLTDGSEARLCLNGEWPQKWRQVWSVPLTADGETRGVVQAAFADPRPMEGQAAELLRTAAGHAAVSLARLDGRDSLLQSCRSLLQVEEMERKRISRELHDDAAQALAVIRLQLEMIEMSLPPDAGDVRARVAETREVAEQTIVGMRGMISKLSPAVLEQLGLAAAVRQLANRLRSLYPCELKLDISPVDAIESHKQMVLYRVAQECLANIAQHSSAKTVNVSLQATDGVLRLIVEDDGLGFAVNERMGQPECFGLRGMHDRVSLIGGKFRIESTPQKGRKRLGSRVNGTRISVEVPVDARETLL